MQIAVIGLGVAQQAQLSMAAQQALAASTRVIGSERQLATVADYLTDQQQLVLPPLKALPALLASSTGAVAILASGDPLWYGIGRWLSKQFATDQLRFFPAVSSIQVACHQLGLSQQDVEVISLHGRPLASLRQKLRANQTLVVLTDAQSAPQYLARALSDAGFSQATVTVCEMLGYPQQQVRRFDIAQLCSMESAQIDSFDPLHVSIIETGPAGPQSWLPQFPGIEDHHFVTDRGPGKGMLTKREVRLQILSLLQPGNRELIWDIGAGCGSVAVELAYWAPQAKVLALEHHPDRFECLELNRERFGVVQNLEVREQRVTAALVDLLPQPQKIFIGGSDGELPELLQHCWQRLPPDGVLVASAVMERSRSQLLQFMAQLETQGQHVRCQTLQVAISRGETLAGQLCYKPALPVTLFQFTRINTREAQP
ncbi:MAG: precorrin-6y C5,15-methyltransferase (decarboxylating) subunit CbiE [Marinobacterium sp.]|nr:precorrin-6y C5,15-methyltransferase (decarboxylating) subunit CbiE [Marinobacterium sp.]